jgi:hypothetical protein
MNILTMMVNQDISIRKANWNILIRVALHVLFWFFFTVLFLSSKEEEFITLYWSWISILSICAIVVYINLYFLLPRLFFKKKYLAYAISLPACLVLGAFLIQSLSGFRYMVIDTPFGQNLKNLFFFVVFSSSFKFYRENDRKLILLKQSEHKQLQTELSLLKSQVNPHFLFNTLNNMYATNLHDHEKANEMILQLADILRFQLEVSQKSMIFLEEEIRLIENYITLEKIRLHKSNVEVLKHGDFSGYEFSPLLLLPLVENAFKYGKNRFIFNIKLYDNDFIFETENEIQLSKTRKMSGGLGLPNVQKRLELVYPGRFVFNYMKEDNIFKVYLKIQL